MRYLGNKHSIIIGLVFEMLQLFMLGFGSQAWSVSQFCIYLSLSLCLIAHTSFIHRGP